MKTTVVVFPFDLFGSPGSSSGALLLGEAVEEMLGEIREEQRPTRGHIFADQIKLREFAFDTLEEIQAWRKTGRTAVRQAWRQDAFLLYLAGNHLGVLPVYEELGADDLVLQLDAHLDVYNLSDCTEALSHGNFLLHATTALPTIINLGNRDLFLPQGHVQQNFAACYPVAELFSDSAGVCRTIAQRIPSARRVFLDIDCDVFDPAYFPATSHPLPFGIAPAFVLQLIQAIGIDRLAGVAISEFDPARDRNDQSLNTLGWFLEWLLLQKYGG